MNIISTTAKANLKQNKSRNILIGMAIILTAILLTAVPIVGLGSYQIRMEAANKVLPTYHAVYRSVDEAEAEQLKKDTALERAGLRLDLGQVVNDEATIMLTALDDEAAVLNKLELKAGQFPKKEDEIVVSKGILDEMGISGEIGDTISIPYQAYEVEGMSLQREKTFTIVGMLEDTEQNRDEKRYSSLVAVEFAREQLLPADRAYWVYIRLADSEGRTTDQLKAGAKTLGEQYQVKEEDIVSNSEYLIANYIDPAAYTAVASIMIIIILAAVMTIYSIYYVSMRNKIQEYGKLKAMGATRKQIKSLVFREGFFIACMAIPAGILLGCGIGYGIVYFIIDMVPKDDFMVGAMQEVLYSRGIWIIQPWIPLVALVTALCTVYFSLLKPMKIAGKISAVEAIRCHSTQKETRKKRKGYEQISLTKLTLSNLSRNRGRTAITVVTLGIISILFMTVASVLNCLRPEDRARQSIRSDFELSLDYSRGDKMHPERELNQMHKENLLGKQRMAELNSIEGIVKTEAQLKTIALVEGLEIEGKPFEADVVGLQSTNLKEIEKKIVDGKIDWDKLYDGSGVIMSKGYMEKMLGVKVGDHFTVQMRDGDEIIPHTFTIMASTDVFRSTYASGDFIMPAETLQKLFQTNLVSYLDITVKKGSADEVGELLKALVDKDDRLKLGTFEEELGKVNQEIELIASMTYGFLSVLGIVGIMNLINTMINSVYIRKNELGVLQAIGMSDRQMLKMLQLEGLFYTAGTLILGLGVGNILGYLCFLYARDTHFMDVKLYHYPVIPTILLAASILVVQLSITFLIGENFKKESLIERIRFSQ